MAGSIDKKQILSKGRRPSGAALHSSHEPVVRRPCSDLIDMLRRLINCHIITIIIIIWRDVVVALIKYVFSCCCVILTGSLLCWS